MPETNNDMHPSRQEHETLKESLQKFVTNSEERMNSLGDAILAIGKQTHDDLARQDAVRREDTKELHRAITELGSGVYERINRVDGKRQRDVTERSKLPVGVIAILVSIIVSLTGALTWNMSRIESDRKDATLLADQNSKERHNSQDIVLQREMRLLNTSVYRQQERDHESIKNLTRIFHEHELRDAQENSRTDERVKILSELKN